MKLLKGYHTDHVTKYTIDQAQKFVKSQDMTVPAAVVLQQMSNDISKQDKSAEKCAEDLLQLVLDTRSRFPPSKIVVSLPPGRGDRKLHLKTQTANLEFKRMLLTHEGDLGEISICDNTNLLVNDAPTDLHFQDDMIHLNLAGTKRLAENIRENLRLMLQIPRSQPKDNQTQQDNKGGSQQTAKWQKQRTNQSQPGQNPQDQYVRHNNTNSWGNPTHHNYKGYGHPRQGNNAGSNNSRYHGNNGRPNNRSYHAQGYGYRNDEPETPWNDRRYREQAQDDDYNAYRY